MRQSLPIHIGLLYAAGEVGPTLSMLCLGFFWLYFLIQVAGFPPLEAGLIQGSGFAVSAAMTLAAGRWLDRHARPRVRARLIAGAGIGMAACFALLWIVPSSRASWRVIWYLVWSWLFHAQFAFMYLEYLSLARRITTREAERVELNSWRFGVSLILTILLLAFYAGTERAWPLGTRLLALALLVSVAAAGGSLTCGAGFRHATAPHALTTASVPPSWRTLARSRLLWWAVGANLAVWLVIQTVLVLTVFLSAAAGVNQAATLMAVQIGAGTGMVLAGLAARRVKPDTLLHTNVALFCAGALLWFGLPLAACACLGLGLGAATVLTWTRLPTALDLYASNTQAPADGRVYAGLTVLRDTISALVPVLAAIALRAGPVGSIRSGHAALALLLVNAGAAALVITALRSPARAPAAGAGTAGEPTARW